jgi:hypothetical protein
LSAFKGIRYSKFPVRKFGAVWGVDWPSDGSGFVRVYLRPDLHDGHVRGAYDSEILLKLLKARLVHAHVTLL